MLRLGTPVDGTSNVKNAQISIDIEDVNALLLAPETTMVYVGGSVAVLKDALNKGGQCAPLVRGVLPRFCGQGGQHDADTRHP